MAKGLPSSAKRLINSVVENLFDRMALNLLGDIPELKNRKVAFFSTSPNLGLANLFVQVLNRNPSQLEADILKGLLTTAHTYLESLKNKTKSSQLTFLPENILVSNERYQNAKSEYNIEYLNRMNYIIGIISSIAISIYYMTKN
jgi:hypothetical protein